VNKQRPRDKWQTVWRGYTFGAVQTCTMLLIVVLLNAAMCGVLSARGARDSHRLPSSLTALESRLGPAWVSALYPGWDENALLQLYDEWQSITFDYEPFTQFKIRPMHGVYMNVSENGYRLNGADAP
jgi:hypothetical protein